jgi:hypothetical protein
VSFYCLFEDHLSEKFMSIIVFTGGAIILFGTALTVQEDWQDKHE